MTDSVTVGFRFLNAIKQFLCLSLLKNSALSAMAIFQLQCCIFTSLLTKFRSGLKAEVGIFFPMLVLRVLENVLQPSFLQKMTVLNLLDKISQDSQTMVDIFVNYDCDVDSPNIFERYCTCPRPLLYVLILFDLIYNFGFQLFSHGLVTFFLSPGKGTLGWGDGMLLELCC